MGRAIVWLADATGKGKSKACRATKSMETQVQESENAQQAVNSLVILNGVNKLPVMHANLQQTISMQYRLTEIETASQQDEQRRPDKVSTVAA